MYNSGIAGISKLMTLEISKPLAIISVVISPRRSFLEGSHCTQTVILWLVVNYSKLIFKIFINTTVKHIWDFLVVYEN
jgi:hypothetical protein